MPAKDDAPKDQPPADKPGLFAGPKPNALTSPPQRAATGQQGQAQQTQQADQQQEPVPVRIVAQGPAPAPVSSRKLDETRKGGYYIQGNRAVNANGETIEEFGDDGEPADKPGDNG